MAEKKYPESVRFSPPWNPYGGKPVCGLVELMCDVGAIYDYNPINAVEVGSLHGESGLIISSFPFVKKLVCVDSNKSSIINKRLRHKITNNSVEIVTNTSVEYSKFVDNNSIDLVYIDADHDYESVKQDLNVWFPKVKTGGFITGHDYSKKFWGGVVQAVDELVCSISNLVLFKTYIDTSYLIRK